jgi:hypothetical protein
MLSFYLIQILETTRLSFPRKRESLKFHQIRHPILGLIFQLIHLSIVIITTKIDV